MRHRNKWLLVLVIALVTGWSVYASAEGAAGKITRVTGKVSLLRGGSSISAKVGMGLNVGDIIQTEAGSYAKFLMSDGTMINVAPSSRVRVKSYLHDPRSGMRAANYDLVYGRGRAQVPKAAMPPNIRFSTPTAVAGVRGTELIFSYDAATGQTTIVAVDGQVEVANPDQPGQMVNLTPGMATTVGTGMIPTSPLPMSPVEINNLRQDTTGSDPSPHTTVIISVPGTGAGDFKLPAGYVAPPPPPPGNDGVVGTPQNLINQQPPLYTPVIINIYLK